ncbi:MAG: hypothetical protein QG579_264 [Patescibacteria group bacterium]|nr:hypothetical protein [Patescibacteria group bacterium]
MMQSPIIPLIILVGIFVAVFAAIGNKKSRVKSASSSTPDSTNKNSLAQSKTSIKDKVKGWWGKSQLFRVIVFIALAVGLMWAWQENGHKLDSDTVGSGQTLLDGGKITIEKHHGEDFSELAKYETVAGGFLTRLETQGEKEVYILVWRRNGNEYVPVTQGPRIYRGEPLSRCAVETYSLFLGDNAQIDKLANVVAKVDTSRRCDAIGNIVAVN